MSAEYGTNVRFGRQSAAFGMYQNALIFSGAIAVTFVILVAGAAVDVLLEEARIGIGRVILA